MAWTCRYLAEAIAERETLLVAKEKAALINADAKLEALGPRLPYPHSSAPEAEVDPPGFTTACRRAEARLAKLEQEK